jgi:hypothetical protein
MFINNIENNASKKVMERENSESRKEKQTNGADVDYTDYSKSSVC